MVLVSGPTGSGKSTTLYAMLRAVDYLKRNVVTVEDPIEYNFNFIYQTEVNTSAGYRFSTALKYLMRQDPDVILVGEIRDQETADMCVMASNTGHLVLSTIHANESITTIQRLLSLTTEKETTLSTIKVIAAQRLIRKLCPYCRKFAPEVADKLLKKYPYLKKHIDFEPKTYIHVGCERCRKTGYIGRTTVAEVLKFDDEIIDAFLKDKTIVELHELLRQKDFLDMNDVGILKILMGETDYDEIKRIVKTM
jgi:type II secretory ATPase GspE/PulE/Tfp pilus assembly ATPase PilB-like protein